MDKFEYKVRAQEIKSLIAQGEYAQAAEIADTIDWRRVKSVMMLCTISDLYKINRRYEDARDMLLLAYDRHPGGRTIVYSLCELSIKMEEFVQAVEYYKEFVQIAPKDTGRYILQYKLYEAQDVSLEERIAVLEELKKRDYREKWAYELAYLYHRVGLSARCVEECDELILWFGDGKYVIKAMELKMLHQPLTPNQQQRYDHRFQPHYEDVVPESEENGQELYEEPVYADETAQNGSVYPQEPSYEDAAWNQETKGQQEEFDIQVKTMDVSQYNTINLQKELAEGLKEVLREQEPVIADPVIRDIMAPMMEPETELSDFSQTQEDLEEVEEMEPQETEVFFGETGEIGDVEPVAEIMQNTEYQEEISQEEDREVTGQLDPEDIVREWERIKQEYGDSKQKVFEPEAEADMEPEIEPEAEADMEPEIEPEAEPDEAEELVKIEETEDSQEEAVKEPAKEIPAEEKSAVPVREKANIRNLTKEEKELFGAFIQNRATRNKLITALDQISLAAYTGNVIITGYEGMDTLNLAKNMIRDIQMMDSNLSGKTAKISAAALNQKDVEMILEQLKNGALIVQKASDMNEKTADAMYKKLQQESLGIIVILEDTKKKMDKFLSRNKRLAECFNARLDVEALSNEALVAFGKKYAREMEYSIDELGVLALHTRIEEMQSIDHAVTIMEVRGIMEDAIHHANRKTVKHFLDVLLGKRYDEEDMIILRENDFV